MSAVQNRYFAPVSIAIMGLAAALLTTVGCTQKADYFTSDAESVAPGASEITFENYRDKKIVIILPPGNRNPEINWQTLNSEKNMPSATYSKLGRFNTDELRAELNKRFQKTLSSIAKDDKTVAEIKKAGTLYGIDPVLILGNIVGEHIFNVGVADSVQGYVVQSISWAAEWALRFSSNGVDLTGLLKEAPFGRCDTLKPNSHAEYWECVAEVYEATYRFKVVGGRDFGSKGFKFSFFNPISVGISYGLGQLDPIRALMVTDNVNRTSGFRMISIERPKEIYEDIINPRIAVHYIAANIVFAIDTYKKRAGFDVSQNPGVVATMYNLGREKHFSTIRYNNTLRSLKAGKGVEVPVESYYGFYINEKERELRAFIGSPGPL